MTLLALSGGTSQGPAGGEGVCPRTAASLSWGNSLEFMEAEASGICASEYQRGENSADVEICKGSPRGDDDKSGVSGVDGYTTLGVYWNPLHCVL